MDRMTDEQFIKELEKRADAFFNECLIEELEAIKVEIKDLDLGFFDEDYRSGVARGIMEFNKILNKHISKLKGVQNEEKTQTE